MDQGFARVAENDSSKAEAGKSTLNIADIVEHPKQLAGNLASPKGDAGAPKADPPAPPPDVPPPAPPTPGKDAPPAPAPGGDTPPAPGGDTPPSPGGDTPPASNDPLPPVTDAPWLYVDFDKTYAGDNLKLSFQKEGNNIIATGTISYDKEHTYPFQIATDSFGTSRGGFSMSWSLGDGGSIQCPFPMEINYVQKDVINVNRPESIWITHPQDDQNCPSNSQFQAWKLTKLSEYHEPPPPPPPPPKPPKQPKPDHPPKKPHK